MDKYKVLLVDDEEEAIEAIRLKLEWETRSTFLGKTTY